MTFLERNEMTKAILSLMTREMQCVLCRLPFKIHSCTLKKHMCPPAWSNIMINVTFEVTRRVAIKIYLHQKKQGFKVEKILEGILDLIPSPSLSVWIQIIGGKVYLSYIIRQNIAGWCQKTFFFFKILLTMPSNVLPLHLNQTFPPIIWIFTAGEGDGVQSRLPFKKILLYL